MLKRYMHNRERYLATLGNDRVVHDFDWGMEFVTDRPESDDPREFFRQYSKDVLANSDEFFFSPEIDDFHLESRLQPAPPEDKSLLQEVLEADLPEQELHVSTVKREFPTLTWTSGIKTTSPENNTAYATYFPHETNRKSAVLVLPHWNAMAGTYFDLCKFLNKVGLSSLRLTLPYHE